MFPPPPHPGITIPPQPSSPPTTLKEGEGRRERGRREREGEGREGEREGEREKGEGREGERREGGGGGENDREGAVPSKWNALYSWAVTTTLSAAYALGGDEIEREKRERGERGDGGLEDELELFRFVCEEVERGCFFEGRVVPFYCLGFLDFFFDFFLFYFYFILFFFSFYLIFDKEKFLRN